VFAKAYVASTAMDQAPRWLRTLLITLLILGLLAVVLMLAGGGHVPRGH